MRVIGLTDGPIREARAIKVGLFVGGLTLVLRLVGVVVGPFAVALAIIAVVALPGPDFWSDRFLIAAAALIGWLPIVGWIPKFGRVDWEGVLLAVVTGYAVAYQVATRGRPDRTRRRIKPAEMLAVGVGAAVSLWWAIPFWSRSAAGRMQLFIPGWDNPRHLSLIRLNLKLGSFVAVQPNAPAGLKYDAGEYPQGWHQTWAQLVRLWSRHPSYSARSLVDVYSIAVVVTAGLAVMIGCVAVSRLCRDHALLSLVSMSVVAQLLAVGVMSISVYFGFPNIGIAVIAVAVAPSILLKPTMSPGRAFFVVSGMMLIGVYNWWPLALLAMPTLAVATLRLWKHAGVTGHRRLALVAIGFTAIVMVAPVLLTLHFGVSHLLITGGIPPTPWWLVFASSFGLVAVVALRQVLTRDSLPTLLLGAPALFGAVGVIGLIAYELGQPQGVVSYYGEKAGDALAAFSLVGLALLLADALSKLVPRLAGSRTQAALVGVAAVLASVAVFQVNGYVGPRQSAVATGQAAPGFLAHAQWTSLPHTLDPIADSFLDSVDSTGARLVQTGGLPETYSYVDIEGLDPRPDWTDLWFACLVGGLDTPRLNRAYSFYQLTGVRDPATAAGIITRLFPPDAAPGLKLVVPESLVTALTATSSQWVVGANVFPKG